MAFRPFLFGHFYHNGLDLVRAPSFVAVFVEVLIFIFLIVVDASGYSLCKDNDFGGEGLGSGWF